MRHDWAFPSCSRMFASRKPEAALIQLGQACGWSHSSGGQNALIGQQYRQTTDGFLPMKHSTGGAIVTVPRWPLEMLWKSGCSRGKFGVSYYLIREFCVFLSLRTTKVLPNSLFGIKLKVKIHDARHHISVELDLLGAPPSIMFFLMNSNNQCELDLQVHGSVCWHVYLCSMQGSSQYSKYQVSVFRH